MSRLAKAANAQTAPAPSSQASAQRALHSYSVQRWAHCSASASAHNDGSRSWARAAGHWLSEKSFVVVVVASRARGGGHFARNQRRRRRSVSFLFVAVFE